MASQMGGPSTSIQEIRAYSRVKCITKFCQRCKNIPFDDERFGGIASISEEGHRCLKFATEGRQDLEVDFELVDDWPELNILSASAEDCDSCKFIMAQLKKAEFPSWFPSGYILLQMFYKWDWVYPRKLDGSSEQPRFSLLGLQARVSGKLKQEQEFAFLLWLKSTITADEGDCKRWLHLQPKPPPGLLDWENVSMITAHLQTSPKKASTFLPTRLLDLASHNKGSMFAKLVTKEEVYRERHTFPMYVALSYPWGNAEQAKTQSKTTADNLRDRTTEIKLKSLSRVIQDAVVVCRTFGVRYLWVDALCIIQGDQQDWECESANMGLVYRNAYFTIGAASIESCHESFLSPKANILEVPFISHVNPRIAGSYHIIARPYSHQFHISYNHWEDWPGPWLRRGWAFQERAVSPRLLIFGSTMIFLERSQTDTTFFSIDRQPLNYSSWAHLVQTYSAQELTYEKDTFPAISGLARLYAEQLGDRYLAGCWENDLNRGLFFSGGTPVTSLHAVIGALESRRSYIAPSWSWAARKGRSEFSLWDKQLYREKYNAASKCTIVDAQCVVKGLDPFGIVENGYITICAKTLQLRKEKFSIARVSGWNEGTYHWYFYERGSSGYVSLDGFTESEDYHYEGLVLLLLGSYVEKQVKDKGAYGLVLYPAKEVDEFYRVGVFLLEPGTNMWNGSLRFCEDWEVKTVTLI